MRLLEIKSKDRAGAIEEVRKYFESYKIVYQELDRPWGFFFYFEPAETQKFADEFFEDVELTGIDINLPLQPKVLVFEPRKRLSWQYHHRRAEIWRCITEGCWVMTSPDDNQPDAKQIKFGDVVNSTAGIRHRAGANKEWGAVAEIWQHTDPDNLSDEQDVVRLQDDYGRS
jgi:mannose-6-phosphate isomerase-like protein (cupin superfamily)